MKYTAFMTYFLFLRSIEFLCKFCLSFFVFSVVVLSNISYAEFSALTTNHSSIVIDSRKTDHFIHDSNFLLALDSINQRTTEASSLCIDDPLCAGGGSSSLSRLTESLPKDTCPKFIIEQQVLRDQKISLTTDSPDEICSTSTVNNLNHFKDAAELESYLKQNPFFAELNKKSGSTPPDFSSCLPQRVSVPVGLGKTALALSTKALPESKKKLAVAEYYSSLRRLSDGVERSLQNITAIDLMLDSDSLLSDVPCNNLASISTDVNNQCQSIKQCPVNNNSQLRESAKDTLLALKAIEAIDKEIKRIKFMANPVSFEGSGGVSGTSKKKIEELEERKKNLQNLYPWIVGKVFKDGYKSRDYANWTNEESPENRNFENQIAGLIKDQLTHTREKLKERKEDFIKASSCIKGDEDLCNQLDMAKVLAKTPPINHDEVFERDRKKELKRRYEHEENLSPEERKEYREFLTTEEKREYRDLLTKVGEADGLFELAGCLQTQRKAVKEVSRELALGALDLGIVIGTMGLGSPYVAGRLAVRLGSAVSKANNLSKAKRLQSLGIFGTDVSFSSPYMQEAMEICEDTLNQLEEMQNPANAQQTTNAQTANAVQSTNTECKNLPVRAKQTSDVKTCILQASLASLPITLPILGLSGVAVAKNMFKRLGKQSKPVVVLSGNPPKNPFPLRKYSTSPSTLFKRAYNKGEFTEDEIYIQIPSRYFKGYLEAKIVDLKEDTVIADIFLPSGKIERIELNERELSHAQLSFSSKKEFNWLDKVDAITVPKLNHESVLRVQGHRGIFSDGVDDMHRLQAVGEKLREMNINPLKTHIVDFANKTEDHIQFIRAGIIKQTEELKNTYLLESSIERLDEQFKENMEILERLSLEAKQKVNEESVSYAWWLHWNNRLSILASQQRRRTQLIHTTESNPQERAIISEINENWWKTEETLNRYQDGKYRSVTYQPNEQTSFRYIEDAIEDFPDRIHLPTIEPYGIIAMNMSSQSKTFPVGLVAEPTWADGGLKHPDEFYYHDLNDSVVFANQGGLILNREFNDHFRREVEGLNKRDREQVETVLFSIRESSLDTLDTFSPENIDDLIVEILPRFRNDKDLGGLLPTNVNINSEESIKKYLQESANKFISISSQDL